MREHGRRLPWALMAIGMAMALCALGMLSQTRDALQYCALAPGSKDGGAELGRLSDSARRLGDSMKDALSWVAMGGTGGAVDVTAGENSAQASLYAMGEGWLEVNPRFLVQGRRVGESELRQGDRVAMLDEKLAFRLFGEVLPEDAEVRIGGGSWRVVGTVRHAGSLLGGRGVGDERPYDVYVPLLALGAEDPPLVMLALSAIPTGGRGAARLFEDAARGQWLDGGQLVDLKKEALRRVILPGAALLAVGLYALVGLFRRMTALAAGWLTGFREALSRAYFDKLIGRLAGIVALTLLGYGALIAATWLLLDVAARPLYVFGEWVPENIVSWTSITRVFWSLTEAAATPVRLGTRELRVIGFWGGLLRWGTVLILLGAALRGPKAGERR